MVGDTCQVDFYVLQDEEKSVEHLACQLAMMAWEQGLRSMLLTSGEGQVKKLDELMWSVPAGRFLPHQPAAQAAKDIAASAGPAPVTIGTMSDLDNSAAEVIINLDLHAVPRPGRFKRLLELVPARDAEREASRIKFRTYREVGLQPVSHKMG